MSVRRLAKVQPASFIIGIKTRLATKCFFQRAPGWVAAAAPGFSYQNA